MPSLRPAIKGLVGAAIVIAGFYLPGDDASLPRAEAQGCSPRPAVGVAVSQQAPERLSATFTAGVGTIQQLNFPQSSASTNATVIINGVSRTLPTVYTPPSPVTQVVVTVIRSTIGGTVTVPVEVVDACGTWQTLVGRGTAGWPSTFTPTVTPTRTTTPTTTPTSIPTNTPTPTQTPTLTPTIAPTTPPTNQYCTSTGLGLGVVDDGYNGTLASMVSSTISVPDAGAGHSHLVSVALTHSWVGDLTLKLRSPLGTVVTLASRPGVFESADNGSSLDGFGDSSNLLSAYPITFRDSGAVSAEDLGRAPTDLASSQVIGRDAGSPSTYRPDWGAASPGYLSAVSGQPVTGSWALLIGDSAIGEVGTLDNWCITMTRL